MRDLGQSMEDYELVEMLLMMAQPRGDVKPLAKALIKRFGTLAGIITATTDELAEVEGIGQAAIVALKLVQSSSLRQLKQESFRGHILSGWDRLLDYLHVSMSREKVEQFRLLFLNHQNHLIADEVQQTGTVNHTPIYPREVVKRALALHASAIIMVHNHPSGDTRPSSADISMTQSVKESCKMLDVVLHDHIIIGPESYFSFKNSGLI